MRYSTVPAINLQAHIDRNREIIAKLPQPKQSVRVWNPQKLRYVWVTNQTHTN